ncbi:hypothetical protein [Paenibacillus baimaensis]|nr:hypothetical protein [Paenibacillus sp. WQ 127069]
MDDLKQVIISIASLSERIAKENGELSESIRQLTSQKYNSWISYTEQKEHNKDLIRWMKQTFEKIK